MYCTACMSCRCAAPFNGFRSAGLRDKVRVDKGLRTFRSLATTRKLKDIYERYEYVGRRVKTLYTIRKG